GLPPMYYADNFDAYTDFLNVLNSSIPACSPGCEERNVSVAAKVDEFFTTVKELAQSYPQAKFIFNTRNQGVWLAGLVNNCWGNVNPKREWVQYLQRWEECCGSEHGRWGNLSCWRHRRRDAAEGGGQPGGQSAGSYQWMVRSCCEPLRVFRWAWHAMHAGVASLFADDPARLLHFDIDTAGEGEALGAFLGVPHIPGAWRRIRRGILQDKLRGGYLLAESDYCGSADFLQSLGERCESGVELHWQRRLGT
ncbi:unnamed protein product, partial [Prorocentrum cordatum]